MSSKNLKSGQKALKKQKSNLDNESAEKKDEKPAKLKSFPEVTGIVLIMIVKNESRIIARCLDQAKPVISGICITDTGSTDNCIDCIQKWGEENNIPCQVPTSTFRDFGYSRTMSFLNGRKYFPNASYYLLLDADLNLIVNPSWNPNELTHDKYMIYQQTKTNRYQNVRLIKANKSWKCVGVTHEYWDCQNASKGILHSLWIDDKDDGGCKQDKYVRDKRLLLAGIADPKTPQFLVGRYRFYLGQTYFCLKEFDYSIQEYQRRIDLGGWFEEVWYSQLQIGKAYLSSNRPEMAIAALLKSWNMHPKRAEPLMIISQYYREKGMNHLGYYFAKLAQDQGYPMNDSLFIDSPTYLYKIDYEISINAYHIKKKELGCQSHLRLKSIYHKLPRSIQESIDNNNKFYLC